MCEKHHQQKYLDVENCNANNNHAVALDFVLVAAALTLTLKKSLTKFTFYLTSYIHLFSSFFHFSSLSACHFSESSKIIDFGSAAICNHSPFPLKSTSQLFLLPKFSFSNF